MKDQYGLYYYPNPLQKQFRVYVRQIDGEIQFRMWNDQDPALWQQHGWVSYTAILEAAEIYDGNTLDPKQAYDIEIARALVKQNQ